MSDISSSDAELHQVKKKKREPDQPSKETENERKRIEEDLSELGLC